MQTQPDIFLHVTATGWTAIGSIIGAVSIVALSIFNVLTLRAAFRATRAAESQAGLAQTSLKLLRKQLTLTERPFIAIRSKYCNDIGANLVYAHNQGSGPALDVEASLTYDEAPVDLSDYTIGCLAINEEFQFLIGDRSLKLSAATFWYKSISGEKWTTQITLLAGHPVITVVMEEHQNDDGFIQNILRRATQTEE